MSLSLVTRFFQYLFNRQFAEAERELLRLKEKMHKTEWNHGYIKALEGLILTIKFNDQEYSFLTNKDIQDVKKLGSYRRDFLKHVKNKYHGDYDRGFFSAWSDCIRVLIRINEKKVRMAKSKPDKMDKRVIEDKYSDKTKNQASISKFLTVS